MRWGGLPTAVGNPELGRNKGLAGACSKQADHVHSRGVRWHTAAARLRQRELEGDRGLRQGCRV
jgi:hypothetical protein